MSDTDDYAARVRAALGGQIAPLASQGSGRRILLRCPQCGRAWLQDGTGVRVDLSAEDTAALAAELAADMERLPLALCRICGAQGIGEINIDAYGAGAGPDGSAAGLGMSWEGADPPGSHLLGTVINLAYAERLSKLGRSPRSDVVTDFAQCRAWLAWLAELRTPLEYHKLTPQDSANMARTNRPGHGAPGTDGWLWRGVGWRGPCPALGGRCLATLAQAMPPGEPFSPPLMFATWNQIARLVLSGHITGEPQ